MPEMSDPSGTVDLHLPKIVSATEFEELAERTGSRLDQGVLDPYLLPSGSPGGAWHDEDADAPTYWIPMPTPPRPARATVWHYTNAGGAIGIITHDEVWATSTNSLNDSEEFTYGIRMLEEQLARVMKSRQVHRDQKAFMEEAVRLAGSPRQVPLFVFCASEKKDSLSQWRAYGDDVGYAIGLQVSDGIMAVVDGEHAPRPLPPVPPYPTWGKVLYEKARQRDLLLRGLSFCAVVTPGPGESQDEMDSSLQQASGVLVSLAMYCKNAAFSDEREVRLVTTSPHDAGVVEFRASAYGVAPYVRLAQGPSRKQGERALWTVQKKERLPVSEVYVGPTSHADAASQGIRQLLQASGHGPVPVKLSTAPLRSR